MAVVETLEVRFQANMGNLAEQLNGLSGRVMQLNSAFENGRMSLGASAQGMIAAVADALKNGAAGSAAPGEAGRSLVNGFAQALIAGMPRAASSAGMLAQAADFSNASALASARSAGSALGQGFANGISSSYGAVMAAANRIASAAVARIRSALKIHSPSRVSHELGGYFGEGFAEGIYASVRTAQQSVGALSEGAVSALAAPAAYALPAMDTGGLAATVQQAVQDALGGTSIVVPLHVDGMKLGEASIRGINRVTRSAGRLMLEI